MEELWEYIVVSHINPYSIQVTGTGAVPEVCRSVVLQRFLPHSWYSVKSLDLVTSEVIRQREKRDCIRN